MTDILNISNSQKVFTSAQELMPGGVSSPVRAFKSVNGQHPPILKMFLSKKINFETVWILDEILSFTKQLNKNINEKVLWPKLYDRMIRYRAFLNYNLTKYKMTLKRKLKL